MIKLIANSIGINSYLPQDYIKNLRKRKKLSLRARSSYFKSLEFGRIHLLRNSLLNAQTIKEL